MNVRTSLVRRPDPVEAHRTSRALVSLLLAGLALGGCTVDDLPDPDGGAPIARPSTPSYAEAATAHNARATVRTAISADAVGTLSWTDPGPDGQPVERIAQIEGKIFADGPGRVHFAMRKLSQTGAVLGMGSGIYFFIILSSGPRTMFWGSVGEPIDYARLPLRPEEGLSALLGAVDALDDLLALGPVPTGDAFGSTQWSTNGHLLGISYRRAASGGTGAPVGPLVRRWVAGDSDYRTVQTEIFDVGGDGATRVTALARMMRSDVLVGGAFAPPPVLPLELQIVVGSAEPIHLDLRISEVRAESNLSPALFDAREQFKAFNVESLRSVSRETPKPQPKTTPQPQLQLQPQSQPQPQPPSEVGTAGGNTQRPSPAPADRPADTGGAK